MQAGEGLHGFSDFLLGDDLGSGHFLRHGTQERRADALAISKDDQVLVMTERLEALGDVVGKAQLIEDEPERPVIEGSEVEVCFRQRQKRHLCHEIIVGGALGVLVAPMADDGNVVSR